MESEQALNEAFAKIFQVGGPYGGFQIQPARHLLAGRNVILQAPTGSGKTKAALFPYLLARVHGLDFPQKMLYCVPMRVLARSFYEDLKNRSHAELDARLQTGEQQDDRKLEGDITFATIDQVLSSFLNIPYSLSLRQGNLNAGAVVSSYLVFDEFHLLDSRSTLPTTLEMLRMLKGVTPFVLMTATFSRETLDRLACLLDAEQVTVGNEEVQRIPTQRDKKRWFHKIDGLLTAKSVLQHHCTRSIAICNTVDRARALYEELRVKAGSNIQVILLHSRFLRDDRRNKEDEARRLFGKERDREGGVILVATQVIEVGLDITCEVMHTEVAPASAVLQRAGRCARFWGESGDVYIYKVPLNRRGEPNYAPYQPILCQKTWEALPSFVRKNMDFANEQRLVNQVHTEVDARMLAGLEQASYVHRRQMNKAIMGQEMGLARELIRHDDSVTVLIHSNPVRIDNPYELEGFSLSSNTLHKQFKAWQETGLPNEEIQWLLKYPGEKTGENGEDRPLHYEWVTVKDHRELRNSAVHVVNPFLVRYDAELGFRFDPGDSLASPSQCGVVVPAQQRLKWRYRRESYQEHVEKMLVACHGRLAKEMAYAASRLEERMGLSAGSIESAIRLAVALHDVGKMDRGWQKWAHEWQERIGAPVAESCILAHTDYDSEDLRHRSAEAEMSYSRPPHAGEGAVATLRILHQLLGKPGPNDPEIKLMKAVFTAIVRHHSPKADRYKAFNLHTAAVITLAQVLVGLGAGGDHANALETSKSPQPITGLLVQSESSEELLAYFLIVRTIRLADQGAIWGVE